MKCFDKRALTFNPCHAAGLIIVEWTKISPWKSMAKINSCPDSRTGNGQGFPYYPALGCFEKYMQFSDMLKHSFAFVWVQLFRRILNFIPMKYGLCSNLFVEIYVVCDVNKTCDQGMYAGGVMSPCFAKLLFLRRYILLCFWCLKERCSVEV